MKAESGGLSARWELKPCLEIDPGAGRLLLLIMDRDELEEAIEMRLAVAVDAWNGVRVGAKTRSCRFAT